MTGRIASLNGTTFPALELQGRTCQRESGCVGHGAGSEGCIISHGLSQGWGNFLTLLGV